MPTTARPRRPARLAPLLAALTLATACGPGGGAAPSGGLVIQVKVGPGGRTMTVGHALTFTATVTVIGGAASTEVSWSVVEGADHGSVPGGVLTPSQEGLLHVRATSVADPTAFGEAAVTVVAAPSALTFGGSPAVTRGHQAVLTCSFSGGTGLIEPGHLTVTSDEVLHLTPAATTTYTLTVTNAAGDTDALAFQVEVREPPAIAAFAAAPALLITRGDALTLSATFSGTDRPGGLATLQATPTSGGLSVLQGWDGQPLQTTPDATLDGTVTYQLVVDNGAGGLDSRTLTVTVLPAPAPTIQAFSASPTAVPAGGAVTLTATFSGSVGTITRTVGGVTEIMGSLLSSGTLQVHPDASVTYTLTVDNRPAGDQVRATADVTVTPGRWHTTGPQPAPASQDAALALDAGGRVALAASDLPTVLVLDPAAATWSDAAVAVTSRAGGLAAAFGSGALAGQLLLAGGSPGFATAEVWDPVAGAVMATGPLQVPRAEGSATTLLDGRVLLAGGHAASAELFDPASSTFSLTAGSMAVPLARHAAVRLADGRVLVAGGLTEVGVALASAALFDPTTGLFSATGSLITARSDLALVALPDGRALAIGGLGATGRLASLERWDPATEAWSDAGALPEAVSGAAAALLADGTVLVTGGAVSDLPPGSVTATGTTVVWDPVGPALRPMPATPGGSYRAAALRLPDGRVLVAGGGLDPALIFDPERP